MSNIYGDIVNLDGDSLIKLSLKYAFFILKNIRRNVKSRVERVLTFVMRMVYVNDKRKKKMMQMIFAKSMIAMS